MLLLPHQLLLSLGIIAIAAAQQNFTALIKSRPELSNLSTYFDLHPELVESVLRWPNRAFLAPDDEAFVKETPENYMFGPPLNIIDVDDTTTAALFKYHTLVPYVKSIEFSGGPHIISTALVDPAYTALSGGQVVVGNGAGGQHPIFTSGLQSASTVVVPVSCVSTPLRGTRC
jgi:hypothetical protein